MKAPRLRRELLAELTTDELRLASGRMDAPATPQCPTQAMMQRCRPVASLLDCLTVSPRESCLC